MIFLWDYFSNIFLSYQSRCILFSICPYLLILWWNILIQWTDFGTLYLHLWNIDFLHLVRWQCFYSSVFLYHAWSKSTGQGDHERRKSISSWNVSPLDSVLWLADLALTSQVGQSQHWIEMADIASTETLPLSWSPRPVFATLPAVGDKNPVLFKTEKNRFIFGFWYFSSSRDLLGRCFWTIPGYGMLRLFS